MTGDEKFLSQSSVRELKVKGHQNNDPNMGSKSWEVTINWRLQGHLGKIVLLSWDFWSLGNSADILHQTLACLVSRRLWALLNTLILQGTSALPCTSSATQISDLRAAADSPCCFVVSPERQCQPAFPYSQGQKDSEPCSTCELNSAHIKIRHFQN